MQGGGLLDDGLEFIDACTPTVRSGFANRHASSSPNAERPNLRKANEIALFHRISPPTPISPPTQALEALQSAMNQGSFLAPFGAFGALSSNHLALRCNSFSMVGSMATWRERTQHTSTQHSSSQHSKPPSPEATAGEIGIFPRRKAKEPVDTDKGRARSRNPQPVVVNWDSIKPLYNLPMIEAAAQLGISVTALKAVCRRLGLERWPYRRNYEKSSKRAKCSRPVDATDSISTTSTSSALSGMPQEPDQDEDDSSDGEETKASLKEAEEESNSCGGSSMMVKRKFYQLDKSTGQGV